MFSTGLPVSGTNLGLVFPLTRNLPLIPPFLATTLCWVSRKRMFKRIIGSFKHSSQTQPPIYFHCLVVQFQEKSKANIKTKYYHKWACLVSFPISELVLFHLCFKEWVGLGNKSSGGGCIHQNFQLLNSELSLTFPLNALQFGKGEHYANCFAITQPQPKVWVNQQGYVLNLWVCFIDPIFEFDIQATPI